MKESFTRESPFSRIVCEALRGVAILSIILHNYLHQLPHGIPENEYTYRPEHVFGFLNMEILGWYSFPEGLISYAGHYGVAVFLFLSGLGLGIKYGAGGKDGSVGRWAFIRCHYLKLLRLLIVGMVLYLVVNALVFNGTLLITTRQIIGQLTMTSNLSLLLLLDGPYWFFSLIMELYVVYILLLHGRGTRVVVSVMLICVAFGYLLDPSGDVMRLYRFNFPGQMLPFCLGLLAARNRCRLSLCLNRNVAIPSVGFLLTLPLILAMDVCRWTWLLAPAAVSLNALFLAMILSRIRKKTLLPLVWIGTLSAMIFTIHPAVRLMFVSHDGAAEGGSIASYLIVTIGIAWCVKILMEKIPSPRLRP